MRTSPPSLRFDQKEIGSIFALFVFVALAMFTVGVFVGRGVAQLKYEKLLAARPAATNPPETCGPAVTENPPASAEDTVLARVVGEVSPAEAARKQERPKPPLQASVVDSVASRAVPAPKEPTGLSASAPAVPPSAAQGKFTVQVGSYPSEREAAERVEALRKLGFPYAYFSAKDLGNSQETWFRVWLGYFPDFDSAKRGGESLRQRGEVKNYLVRKTDTAG